MRRIVRKAVPLLVVLAGVVSADPAMDTPKFVPVQPGIVRAEVVTRSAPDAQPMHVWIYRTTARVPVATWPCVFVAAGGSNGATGMKLTDDAAAELLPYVKHGFVVAAYDIDGAVTRGMNEQQFVAAIRAYVKADGGLANLRAAIDLVKRVEPTVDLDRIYVAGHDSAGTLALRAAACIPEVKGVVAYAPTLDPVESLGDASVDAFESDAPGLSAMLRERQPLALVEKIAVPTMLFCAADDAVAPVKLVRSLADALKAAGNEPLVDEVPTGGHVEAMLSHGLDAGAAWLADRATRDATTRPAGR